MTLTRAFGLACLTLLPILGCSDSSSKKVLSPPPPDNLSDGVLIPTGTLTGDVHALVVGDLNGDDLADVALGGGSGQVWAGFSNGAGITPGPELSAGVHATRLAIADIDHDGTNDLVVAGPGAVTMLRGAAGGLSTVPETLATFPDTLLIGTMKSADLNGDGFQEVVMATFWREGVLGLPHYTGRVVAQAGATSIGGLAGPFELGDVNGNGTLDLVSRGPSFYGAPVAVRLGNGDGTFESPGTTGFASASISNLLLADLRGDQTAEVITEHSSGGFGIGIMRWLGAQLGTETAVNGSRTGLYGVAGDWNADGRVDVATAAYLGTTIQLLLGNASGGLAVGGTALPGSEVAEMAAGDMDGNGKTDIVTRGQGAGTLRVLYNE